MRLALIFALAVAMASAQQFVDRVVASVNGNPILWSDVDEEVKLDALLDNRPASELTPAQRNAALDRLIDDELLAQQVASANSDENAASQQEEVDREIRDLRSERNVSDATDWQRFLNEHGVTEPDLRARLLRQVQLLQFVNMRFRPGTQVSQNEIERFYNQVFVPEMKKRGASVPALASVQDTIEKILIEQKVNAALDQYLQVLRGGARIWKSAPFATAKTSTEGKR
jgi:parvulin-like peptidyl-prolyl isomerase